MRNDQIEALAGAIAKAVADAVFAAGFELDAPLVRHLANVGSEAARNAARQGVAKLTAVRIEADTANVVDLRRG